MSSLYFFQPTPSSFNFALSLTKNPAKKRVTKSTILCYINKKLNPHLTKQNIKLINVDF